MTALSDRSCLAIILAAGEGKRMASSMPKVLHPVAGLPMVCHVIDTAVASGATACAVVVGNQAERVTEAVAVHYPKASFHTQTERLGTAHAVLSARDAISQAQEAGIDDIIVLYGDVPLIQRSTIDAARTSLANGADIVVLGFETAMPTGYGRLIMQGDTLTAIREEKDASDEERKITFCNSGIMAFNSSIALEVLDAVNNDNAQNEYYLTDAVETGHARGCKVVALDVPEEETLGVNDRVQLAEVNAIWQRRTRDALMRSGVTMEAPETIILHHDTVVEADAVLEPNLVFGPKVHVASGATIRAFSHLEGAMVGENAIIGPYARLRPGATMEAGSKAGNFVEIKAARIGEGAKVNHLSYIGDAQIGAKANIGAGTITCNYDGFLKHQTVVGEGAFIGTNTALVAPVTIGKNANTAAGSVVYKDVPDDDLAIERSEQKNLSGKAKQLRERNLARKNEKK
ncbi:MAG: bifunctional UDP-N-acetylglucosamine diphosphorylase/glucosamine-1-phosphate N-acetyltransferase GlmU [Pseudomonadota bacterium]